MFELGIDSFRSMAEFAAEVGGGSSTDAKPCLLFNGAEWEHDATLADLRSVLIDFFHQRVVEHLAPLGIEQVLSFTAVAGRKVHVRCYLARLMKSAEGTGPHVNLKEMGPSFDLSLRRTLPAAPDVMKQAMTRPKAEAARPKKVKNIERSRLLGKQGRLHMPRQDLSGMATARFKATRKPKKAATEGGAEGGAGGAGGGRAAGGAARKRQADGGGGAKKKARKGADYV